MQSTSRSLISAETKIPLGAGGRGPVAPRCSPSSTSRQPCGQIAGEHAFELGALGGGQGGHALAPASRSATPRRPAVAPGRQQHGRHLERRMRPAQLFARLGGIGGEQPGAVAAALALQPGDAAAMTVRQAISDGRGSALAPSARTHRLDVVPVDLRTTCQPATRKRSATSSLIDSSVRRRR
jgi:hypothetical protein